MSNMGGEQAGGGFEGVRERVVVCRVGTMGCVGLRVLSEPGGDGDDGHFFRDRQVGVRGAPVAVLE